MNKKGPQVTVFSRPHPRRFGRTHCLQTVVTSQGLDMGRRGRTSLENTDQEIISLSYK
jgi:hypothetical protein